MSRIPTLDPEPAPAFECAPSSVLEIAWSCSGDVTHPAAADEPGGRCARCGRHEAAIVPVREVISRNFTSIDNWHDPWAWGVCAACTWGYSHPQLRLVPHLVRRSPSALQVLTPASAGRILLAGPLGPDSSLVIPLRPGRKHVMPQAVWGRVCVEDAALPWTATEARRLGLVDQLRELGFGPRMLAEPAAPFSRLSTLDQTLWAEVLHAWNELAPWRTSTGPWMDLAIRVTTQAADR